MRWPSNNIPYEKDHNAVPSTHRVDPKNQHMPQPRTKGALPQVGASAPQLRYVKQDRTNADLAALKGEVVVLLSVPSLDTNVCAIETRTFNQRAAGLGAKVIVMSMDLPFAMKRFCETEGLKNVVSLSTMRGREFMANYGVEIIDGPLAGITARAVVVLDEHDKVVHAELVPEIKQEPNYDAALAVLK